MSFLEWLLVIMGLALGLCNVIVYFVFVFSERLSQKKYRRLAFMLAFLSSSFLWYATFFRDIWGTANLSVYVFFIVVFFIISTVIGGFAVLIGVYHKKLVSLSQSGLQKIIQKKVAREAEEQEEESQEK